jgi:hypothetical protein
MRLNTHVKTPAPHMVKIYFHIGVMALLEDKLV